jgi:hypothetical protein
MATQSYEDAVRVFDVQVESISGPDMVVSGEIVTYSVDRYNYTADEVKRTNGSRVHWYVEVDGKQDWIGYNETIELKIEPEWTGKEIRVMAKWFFTDVQEGAILKVKIEKEDENYNTWEINDEGHITKIDVHERRKSNRLYAVDERKNRTGKYLELKNSDALEELAIEKFFEERGNAARITQKPMRFAIGSPSDLAAIFLFASDNTDREWRFSRYNAGNGDQYAVGTIHETHKAITPSRMGIDPQKEIASIHSHPNEKTGTTEKKFESMGWRIRSDAENDFLRQPRGSSEAIGDSGLVAANENNLPSNQYLYVYFPHTGMIFRVRGREHPEFIRNIKNHNNDPTRLFWGVLNGK